MFVLNSDITIGKFRFSGVHDVRISSGLDSVTTMAYIKLPAKSSIVKRGQAVEEGVITSHQFKEGDEVIINLGYNGVLKTEFRGFVKQIDMNRPLTVICEGYSWLLRRNKVNISKRSVSIKALLAEAIKGLSGIEVICEADIQLTNIQVNGTGADVINAIRDHTDHTLTLFFKDWNKLWCGNLKTMVAHNRDALKMGKVEYRSGINIFSDNTLKRRNTTDDPVEVKYSKKNSEGTVLTGTSDAFKKAVRKHSKLLNQVKEATALKLLADEKAYKENYEGFEGSVQTFLEPYVQPGYVASLTDNMLELKAWTYLVESVTTHFGTTGARRSVELGPATGFANH
jgi:hypothetical protein